MRALAPVSNGHRYLNFADRPVDARAGFSPYAYQRLTRLRASYDPTGLFRANHQIAPSNA